MPSTVYFMDLRATFQENLTDKLTRLIETAGIEDVISTHDLTAVKLHFGELGNVAFIKPAFVRKVCETVDKRKASPFLVDTNTLYKGTRSDTPSHIKTAIKNGFAYSVVGAPIVIADGLRGRSDIEVPVAGKHFNSVHIGLDVYHADALIALSHFKGHELSGFGGALKNLGMGCASRRGKLDMHSTVSPRIIRKRCIGCEECIKHCPADAITVADSKVPEKDKSEKKAAIDEDKCVGCGECIVACPVEAVQVRWNQTVPTFLEGMMEYAKGAVANKAEKCLYVNFITDVSPMCDCIGHNDVPIVRDIGILASKDPVAIDQASVDLVNRESALIHSCLKDNTGPGEDKFKGLYPKVDWQLQLAHAQELGMGKRAYDLIPIETKGIKS